MTAKSNQSNSNNKMSFTAKEKEFLLTNDGCRVATVTSNGTPHITPVSYIFEHGRLYFATDYNTQKYKNLKQNPEIAVAVDIYSSVSNIAVIIHGKVNIVENGEKFQKLYNLFCEKFEWVRLNPWKEGEAPFIEVEPYKRISWGL